MYNFAMDIEFISVYLSLTTGRVAGNDRVS